MEHQKVLNLLNERNDSQFVTRNCNFSKREYYCHIGSCNTSIIKIFSRKCNSIIKDVKLLRSEN